jgi:hypothetical protein
MAPTGRPLVEAEEVEAASSSVLITTISMTSSLPAIIPPRRDRRAPAAAVREPNGTRTSYSVAAVAVVAVVAAVAMAVVAAVAAAFVLFEGTMLLFNAPTCASSASNCASIPSSATGSGSVTIKRKFSGHDMPLEARYREMKAVVLCTTFSFSAASSRIGRLT